ncbi:CocE/NonD family hydrolase [Mesorhizobium sp. M0174]|uniref:CocE/NonD family hydrolase n=1 Tax=Mesorhizobium sp. M0174 TaxID=2956904 RepID=UPI00333A878E
MSTEALAVSAGLHAPNDDYRLLPSIKVPMRDDVNLATDVYLPNGPGPFPIILIRTPYNKNDYRPAWVAQGTSSAVQRGGRTVDVSRHRRVVDGFIGARVVDVFIGASYALVIQDFRGKYESEGVFQYSKSERRDFEDTARWLDAQPWSARRMGMWGCSYLGHVQAVASVTDTPSLKAVNPNGVQGAWSTALGRYSGMATYRGGAREYASMLDWFASPANASIFLKPDPAVDSETWARFHNCYDPRPDYKIDFDKLARDLPLLGILDRAGLPPTEFNKLMSNLPESRYWSDDNEMINNKDKIYTPALWMNNWNDILPGEAIDGFNWAKTNAANAAARDNQYLVIGPGHHCDLGRGESENAEIDDLEVGDTRFPFWDIVLKWNDRWVKGDVRAIDGMPKVTYWLYGKNEWRTSTDMPVPGTLYQDWYLSSQSGANSLDGDGKLSLAPAPTSTRDTYRYDPRDPVPTEAVAWNVLLTDQRSVEARHDVLVYTSEPLRQGLTVVGAIKMVLHVSSSAVDTDFTGKLVDVYPDGRAIQLQLGILRARYRNGFLEPELLTPGKTYEIEVELNAIANWFAPGHRIRLEVSSSNFPRFDRNLNTGGNGFLETEGLVAQNTIISGPSTPSRLVLPIAPD